MKSNPGRDRSPALRRAGRVVCDLVTTGHVLATFVAVEVSIRFVRLPRLARTLGCRLELDAGESTFDTRPELPGSAIRQLRCVRRVARRWPFGSGPCLRTALVAGHLLRRLDPAIRLGSSGTGVDLSAHAWLEIDGRPLQPVDRYRTFGPASVVAQ